MGPPAIRGRISIVVIRRIIEHANARRTYLGARKRTNGQALGKIKKPINMRAPRIPPKKRVFAAKAINENDFRGHSHGPQ